jgi:phage terminase large subunit-like protein
MEPQRNHINCETKNSPDSRIELLSADYDSMDGFNVHGALVDELHAHRDSGIWDVLESARGARRQPLMWGITTAGKNHNSFCYELRSYAIKVLEGSIPEAQCDNFFAIIFTLDDGDDWQDPEVWIKANPNLGVSVSLKDMLEQSQKAKEMPTARIEFQTKRLNMWVYADTAWMNMTRWNQRIVPDFNEHDCWEPDSTSELDGMDCHGGLDLASVEDICALSFCFTLPSGKKRFICRGYLPESAFKKRIEKGGQLASLYKEFKSSGLLVITPGEVCDYDFIKADILAACKRFNVKEIAFDRWNSSQLVNELLEEEVPMIQMGQGYASVNPPMKEMLRLVLADSIEFNNSLLTFAMSNVVATSNPAGDIKYDKSKVSEKIDPAVAAIMSLGRSMLIDDDGSDALNDFLENPIRI